MNKKVLAMYQAVVDLLEAGVDITTLKVADITQKAGIGKGTAYEYFSSKEEIIAKALHWDLDQQLESMSESLRQVDTMKEQIFMGLGWIEQNVHRKSMVTQFMRTSCKNVPLKEPCEYLQENEIQMKIKNLCDQVLETGEKEGLVSANVPDFMKYYILVSNCIGFFTMMHQVSAIPGAKEADLKQCIYDIMVKSLQ